MVTQPTPEEAFRSSLQDAIAIIEKMAVIAETPEQLVELLKLGVTNDAQLRWLMKEVVSK